MKYFLLTFLLFTVLVANSQQNSILKLHYEMEINSVITSEENMAGLPANIKVALTVITDSVNYYLHTRLISFQAGGAAIKTSKAADEDSIFFETTKGLAYLLSSREYCFYDTLQLGGKASAEGSNFYQQNNNEIVFKMTDTLPQWVKPFPQFLRNKFGIVSVSKNASFITLKKVERDTFFDFTGLKSRIASFNKKDTVLELPF